MSWYNPASWDWGALNPLHWGDESQSTKDKRNALNTQAGEAGQYAGDLQADSTQMTYEAAQARDYLRQLAEGKNSIAAEQLRQGLGQNLAAQQSMAASARPSSGPMAARTAMMNAARLGYGLSGQQALAGLAERQAAQKALADMIMGQRGQDVQGAIGSRQNAIAGYGGVTPEGSTLDKWGGAITGGLNYLTGMGKGGK